MLWQSVKPEGGVWQHFQTQYLHVHVVLCVTLYMAQCAHTDPHSKLNTGMVTSQPQCRIKCKDKLQAMNC